MAFNVLVLAIFLLFGFSYTIAEEEVPCLFSPGNHFHKVNLFWNCTRSCGGMHPGDYKSCVRAANRTGKTYHVLEGTCIGDNCTLAYVPEVYVVAASNDSRTKFIKNVSATEWAEGCKPPKLELPRGLGLVTLGCGVPCGRDWYRESDDGEPCAVISNGTTGKPVLQFGYCENGKCLLNITVDEDFIKDVLK